MSAGRSMGNICTSLPTCSILLDATKGLTSWMISHSYPTSLTSVLKKHHACSQGTPFLQGGQNGCLSTHVSVLSGYVIYCLNVERPADHLLACVWITSVFERYSHDTSNALAFLAILDFNKMLTRCW